LIQDKRKPLNPVVPVPTKEGTIETILEEKYRIKHPKELAEHLSATRRKSAANGYEDAGGDLEMEALEASVENEYIGFDNLKKQSIQNVKVNEKSRFLSGTTLENLLDDKGPSRDEHPMESDLLSKYIADKTNTEDGAGTEMDDSNSEYDPVVQSAKGVDKRRNTHSESEEDRESGKAVRKRGRPKSVAVKQVPLSTPSPSLPPPPAAQPVRKSSRFEVSPRPGLALATPKSRRSTVSTTTGTTAKDKEEAKPSPATKSGRGRPPGIKNIPLPAVASTSATGLAATKTRKRTLKGDTPPRLTREVFLDAQEVEDLLGTPTESEVEGEHEEGEEGAAAPRLRRRKAKKPDPPSSDEDYEVGGSDTEEPRNRRKSKATATPTATATKKGKKEPVTYSKRRKSLKKKEGKSLAQLRKK